MLLNFITLALLALFSGLIVAGVVLLRRRGWRIVGAVLLVQALLALAALVALSILPFGIGEPLIRVPFVDMLAQAGLTIAAIAGVGALLFFGGRWLGRRFGRVRRPYLAATGLLVALPLAAGGGMYGLARWSVPERERERDPLKREIKFESGFQASVYASGTMDNPTVMAFGPDNKLYIGDISGSLWVAIDKDNDFKIDSITPWAQGFDLLVGLAWRNDELYVASSGKIEALRDSDGDGQADQKRLLVDGLPSMVLRPHSNNGLVFGKDDRLYFGVGSTTSGEYEPNDKAASILSIKPDGSDLQVFARGLGNTFDIAFNRDGELFGGDNSPGAVVPGEDPPDEFNHLIKGEHYGFPYFYGDPPKNGGTRGATATFPPHSVPTGVTFYTGNTYPPQFRDSAFITLWTRGEIARIEVARTSSGDYLSRTSTFGSGFLYPIDAVTGPDGNLYIADFGTSAIYRVTYDPNKALQ